METARQSGIDMFPLYPYPNPQYMHVIRDSYVTFDPPLDPIDVGKGYKSQRPMSRAMF